ncbi:hypothetical protein AAIR98_001553 [Elusimicrobium simillimum]|uniref:hypothetical protein n=1 Tax=Elusimicrobium simillimum TaxID=3143438 RepID=UPI003C6EAED6
MKKMLLFAVAGALILVVGFFVFSTVMFVYVENKFKPITPIGTIYNTATYPDKRFDTVLMVHQVNSPRRAAFKEKTFNGFELDIITDGNGKVSVAHDDRQLKHDYKLEDIFAAMQEPQTHLFWFDVKNELTQQDIDAILAAAAKFNIPKSNMLFERTGGETLTLLNKNGLLTMYQIIDSFDKDGGDPARREEINAEMQAEIEKYKPFAIVASLGKYPYLRTYFPNMKKAIHYSTTKRPSIKKILIERKMLKDPKAEFFMVDEYTYIPL